MRHKPFILLFFILTTAVAICQEKSPEQKTMEPFVNDSIPFPKQITSLDSLLRVYQKENNLNGEILVHLFLGSRYIHVGAYTTAQYNLNKAYELGDPALQSWASYLLGDVFLAMDNYKKALFHFDKVTQFKQTTFREEQVKISLTHAKAVCSENLGLYDESLYYYKEAVTQAEERQANQVLALILIQKGTLLAKHYNQFDDAMLDLNKAKSLCLTPETNYILANCYNAIANVQLQSNRLTFVLENINQSNIIASELHKSQVLLSNKKLLADYFKKKGLMDSAYYYLEAHSQLKDSIFSEKSQKQINSLQETFDAEQREKLIQEKKKEIELLKKEEKIAHQQLLIIVGVTLLSLVIFTLIVLKLRSDLKKKKEIFKINNELTQTKIQNKELESIRLKQELELKNKSLTDLAIDISRKKEFTEDILQKLKQLKRTKDKDQLLREIIGYTSRQLNIDARLNVLWGNVETINHKFFENLAANHLNLTKGETQLCTLIRLQLSNKDIATIKDIAPGSVKNSRSMLRKKLQLKEGEKIQDYLVKI